MTVTLTDAIVPIEQFKELPLEPKRKMLNPWLTEQSIILISGWRGTGKTWFALSLLDAISGGKSFGPWKAETPLPCLYLDAEMAGQDLKERIQSLNNRSDASSNHSAFYVYSDCHANDIGLSRAHLAGKQWRNDMKRALKDRKIKVWILDNISSLAGGLDENSKRDWDPIGQWLLELRFAGISTVMLHHLGKGGVQRGTSAREDNLDVSIVLKSPHDYVPEDGCRFIVHFSKSRVPTKDLPLLQDTEFQLRENDNGQVTWTYSTVKKKSRIAILRAFDEGLNGQAISETLSVTKGYVSRVRTEAIKDGYLTPKNKLTQRGFHEVSEAEI